MKNFKAKFLGLALAGLILGACSQTGTYETADLMNEQAVANKAGFKMTPFGNANANAKTTDVSTSGNFTLTFDKIVCQDEEVTATFGGTGFTGTRTVRIQELIEGEWVQVFQQSNAPTGTLANLGVISVGEHTFRWSVAGQNGPNNVVFTVTVNQCGCDDAFSAVTTCNEDRSSRSATFTFTAGDDATYKIQGGLTAFITDVVVDGATVINVTGQGNNIISWTGAMDECDVKTITITWNSTNGNALITGDWSVEKDGEEILTLDELECNDSGEGYAPVL